METHDESEITISIAFLWNIFAKNWLLIVLLTLIAGLLTGGAYAMVYEPIYSSTSEFYVANISTETPLYSSSQTDGATAMATNFSKIALSGRVMNHVAEQVSDVLGRPGALNAKMLSGYISTSVSSEAASFTVTMQSRDAELNFLVMQAYEEILPAYCDLFNNQSGTDSTEPNFSTPSRSIKCITFAELDKTANNRGNLTRYPIIAAFSMLALSYGILLVAELLNTTIYSDEDLKAKVNFYPIVGSIPHWAIGSHDKENNVKHRGILLRRKIDFARQNVDLKLILKGEVPFYISEGFRDLRTNVTFCSTGERGCSVGVVSSIAGSGKSFVMANLAVSLSEMIDTKVLFIDGDLRCPMVHRIFSLENKQGLSNLIVNRDLDEKTLIHSYQNGALNVITSGTIPPNPMELLSCARMEELLKKWKAEYDYVLIDLPPIGEVSDAFAVSKLINGYLFVIRSGCSDAKIVRDAHEMLTEKNVKVFGYVLTDVNEQFSGSYGKYGKYSKYGYYNNAYRTADHESNEQKRES